ncbi:MAG: 2-hydroxyglutaryl-CoA dehydratase [Deltaproteobacteria bacterium]|nr:2-hydroxyglutaryl-CoA dehydratase [Deltaproteobacteria bacterium]MBW2158566.1 2-hydroxyglutaryl-CoA dehydratase [Deltaproteobacteria bacterium]MBW2375215.1 2-hydroxyglutaryl-CoA dehydratase [Deltaproteobacteria bacterium]
MADGFEIDIDKELVAFEAQERAKLGLEDNREQWTDSMIDPFFSAAERPTTTILNGGLTLAHDVFVAAALNGIGYNTRAMEVPDTESLRHGKEFGNKAQCNPTYFTVGNLVKELSRLRDEEGMSTQEIIDGYVFLSAGACGPCRFGMYVTEYRKALRDAGFDGFRVVLFQQQSGFKQATGEEIGLVLNPKFFMALARALFAGDALNVLSYRLRPYEVEEGATDRALAEIKKDVCETLAKNESVLKALWRARGRLGAIELDRLRAKPKVAIIGEFWAMTTEGDGNYHLHDFIESEGGENDIQTLVNWLLYTLWEMRHDTELRMTLRKEEKSYYGLEGVDVGYKMAGVWLGELALRGTFYTFCRVVGLRGNRLPDMDEIAKVGHSFYNNELRGGEGHMEVAKLVLNVAKQKATMTLSVKPFGCMPSSGVSDGVQTVITELHPDAIYCPVETSGDGAVNFYSRVQMYMFKARERARKEHQEALDKYGITEEQAREFLKGSRYSKTFYKAPHVVAGTSADLIHEIGPLIGKGRLARAKVHAMRAATRTKGFLTKDVPHAKQTFDKMAPYLPSLGRLIYVELKEKLPEPKEAWNTLMRRAVPKSDESAEAEIPASHEYIPAPSPRPERDAKAVRLQVVN